MQPDIQKIASLLHDICINCQTVAEIKRIRNFHGRVATVRFPPLKEGEPIATFNGYGNKGDTPPSAHERLNAIQCSNDTDQAVQSILSELRRNRLLDHPNLKIEIEVRRPAKTAPRAVFSLEGIEINSAPVTPKTIGKKLSDVLETLSLAPAEILEGGFRAFKVNGTIDVFAPSPEAAIYKTRARGINPLALTEIIDHEAIISNLQKICQAA